MSEPELSDEETRTLIDYARRKFAEERWPLSPALRPIIETRPETGAAVRTGKAGRAELPVGEGAED